MFLTFLIYILVFTEAALPPWFWIMFGILWVIHACKQYDIRKMWLKYTENNNG